MASFVRTDVKNTRLTVTRGMTRRNRAGILFVTVVLGYMLLLSGCPSDLLTEIEATVGVAVTPPEVVSIYPNDAETGVPINTDSVIVSFTKAIDWTTVGAGSITIVSESGDTVSGTFTISNETIEVSLTKLEFDTEYTVTITTNVLDTDGNGLPVEYSWSFRTGLSADTTAPEITAVHINTQGDIWTNSNSVTVAVEATDNRSVTQLQISNSSSGFTDSGWTTFADQTDWELEAGEGETTIYVKVRDGAGNSSDAFTATIKVDTIAPTFNYALLNGGDSATGSPSVSFDISAKDSGSGTDTYRYRMGADGVFGAWADWTSLSSGTASIPAISLTVAASKTQEFETLVRDVAGNESEVKVSRIIYDETPPSIQSRNFGTGFFPFNGTLLEIVFTEEMDGSTITPTNLTIDDSVELQLRSERKNENS